jgi:hypothetical protein
MLGERRAAEPHHLLAALGWQWTRHWHRAPAAAASAAIALCARLEYVQSRWRGAVPPPAGRGPANHQPHKTHLKHRRFVEFLAVQTYLLWKRLTIAEPRSCQTQLAANNTSFAACAQQLPYGTTVTTVPRWGSSGQYRS